MNLHTQSHIGTIEFSDKHWIIEGARMSRYDERSDMNMVLMLVDQDGNRETMSVTIDAFFLKRRA